MAGWAFLVDCQINDRATKYWAFNGRHMDDFYELVWGLAWVPVFIFMCYRAQRIVNSSVTSYQIKPVLVSVVGSFKPWLIRAPLSSDFCISLSYWIFAFSFSLRVPLISLSCWVLFSESPIVGWYWRTLCDCLCFYTSNINN